MECLRCGTATVGGPKMSWCPRCLRLPVSAAAEPAPAVIPIRPVPAVLAMDGGAAAEVTDDPEVPPASRRLWLEQLWDALHEERQRHKSLQARLEQMQDERNYNRREAARAWRMLTVLREENLALKARARKG